MKIALSNPVAHWLAVAALAAAVFVSDLAIEVGVAWSLLYVVVVSLACAGGNRRGAWIVASACSLLILLGAFVSPAGGEEWKVLVNRLLSLLVVWGAAVVGDLILQITSEQTEQVRRAEMATEELQRRRDDDSRKRRAMTSIMDDLRLERQKLVGSETRFRSVLEHAPAAMIMIDRNGRIVLVNAEAVKMFGYERAELMGQSIEMLLPPRFRAAHPDHRHAFFSSPQTRSMGAGRDLFGLRKNGVEFRIEIGLNPMETDGEPFVLSAVIDVTERKQVEDLQLRLNSELSKRAEELERQRRAVVNMMRDLREQKNRAEEKTREVEILRDRFDLAVRGACDGLWDWELATGKVWYSDQFLELLDYEAADPAFPHELASFQSRLHPDDNESTWAKVNAHLESDAPYDAEFRLRKKSGDWHWFRGRGACTRDGDGNPLHMSGSIHDIHDRKVVEAKLARSQYLSDSLVEHIPDPVFFKDRVGRFIRVNHVMASNAGFDEPQAMIGLTDGDVWSPAFGRETDDDERRILESGKPMINKEERIDQQNGQTRWVLVTKMPLRDEHGDVIGTFGMARDITKLKQADAELRSALKELSFANRELERSNRELDGFAYVTSHDLKTPLRNIANLTQFVVEDAGDVLPQHVREYLAEMTATVELMNQLLNDLLEFSRVGRKESQPESLDLAEVIHHVVQLLSPPKEIAVEIAENLPIVYGPRTVWHQILQNLIDNAVKYHDRARGTITVSGEETDDSIIVRVEDDGPGIEPQFHQKIFQVFQRLNNVDGIEGTGMGLALVKKTVEVYNGLIDVESDGKRGTRFNICWPKFVNADNN